MIISPHMQHHIKCVWKVFKPITNLDMAITISSGSLPPTIPPLTSHRWPAPQQRTFPGCPNVSLRSTRHPHVPLLTSQSAPVRCLAGYYRVVCCTSGQNIICNVPFLTLLLALVLVVLQNTKLNRKMLERPNICYIFEKLGVQGCQI